MMGSDTFIMVALRCSDSSVPSARASSMVRAKNARRAATFITAVSITSPASRGTDGFKTVTVPSPPANSIRTSQAAPTVTDRSLPKKSPPSMCATRAFDPDSGQACIMRCGCFWAKRFTEAAGRRSELPSRSTGFTAEPSTPA